jgi:membrane-associated phospholipid phosphatase
VLPSPTPATTPILRPAAPLRRRTAAIIASTWLVLATLTLAVLSLAARSALYFGIDLQITRVFQSYRPEWFSLFMTAISWPGFPPQVNILVAVIFVLLFVVFSRWKAVSFAFAAAGIAATQLGIKLLVNRPRPSPELVHVVDPSLIGGGMNLSYPAGHPATALVIFGFLWYLAYTAEKMSRWRTLTLIGVGAFITLMGPSRIYQGEHWFSDVVAGYLLGSLWLIVTLYLYEWGKARFLVGRAFSGIKWKRRADD